MTRKHVAEAEARVGAQRARIRRLTGQRPSIDGLAIAAKVLHSFEETLRVMRQRLATEKWLVACRSERRRCLRELTGAVRAFGYNVQKVRE